MGERSPDTWEHTCQERLSRVERHGSEKNYVLFSFSTLKHIWLIMVFSILPKACSLEMISSCLRDLHNTSLVLWHSRAEVLRYYYRDNPVSLRLQDLDSNLTMFFSKLQETYASLKFVAKTTQVHSHWEVSDTSDPQTAQKYALIIWNFLYFFFPLLHYFSFFQYTV